MGSLFCPLPSLGSLDHFELDAVFSGILFCVISRVALIYNCQLYGAVRDFLDPLGEPINLSPFLLIGWSEQQSQKLADGIDSHVNLAAKLFLVAIIACTGAALTGGLKRFAIKDHTALGPFSFP
jgi:hypothetical protein